MKTWISPFVFVSVAALLQAAINGGHASGNSSEHPKNQTASAGSAVLSVSSGFASSPNPLAGRTMVLFKESFGAFLKRKGMFQGPPGSTVRQSPLAVWVYACQTGSPSCQQALYEARPNSVSEAKMDANARATLPGVPPGTYFLFAIAGYNNQFLVWDLRVDLKSGTNSIVLDQRNTASLDADSARADTPSTSSKSGTQPRPCAVSEAPRTVKSDAPANSSLSVIGAGYVYTYTKTDPRSGAVVDSFTERGNFSNTTLYLLDDNADLVLQSAGIQPGLLGSRLLTLIVFDAGSQIENAPGIDVLTSIFGHREDLAELMKEMKADFECAMKAIRAHSVAVMTTDANARGVFPNVPAGRYFLFGRFYRVTKPLRSGGMLWNSRIELKPGQNLHRLSVDDAALK